MVKRIEQRSELEQAEAGLRRGILIGILGGVIFWAAVVMLVVASGMMPAVAR